MQEKDHRTFGLIQEALDSAVINNEDALVEGLADLMNNNKGIGEAKISQLASFWCEIDEFRQRVYRMADVIEDFGYEDTAVELRKFAGVEGRNIEGVTDLRDTIEYVQTMVSDHYDV